MSESNLDLLSNAESTVETPSTTTVPSAAAVWLEIAGAASTKGSAVRELVITELTTVEIGRRKDAVIVLLNKHEEKSKELISLSKST